VTPHGTDKHMLAQKGSQKLLQNCRWDHLPDLCCRAQQAFSCVSSSSEKNRAGQRQTLRHALPLQNHEHTELYLKDYDHPSRPGFNTQLSFLFYFDYFLLKQEVRIGHACQWACPFVE